ncbi:uncharacterized protein LOC143276615 [Babylonia areolata]|uniref:uncharacterized protein LOC143276615 n=1 Tax=Babylonia areolata TaxID=304850 RepID=UPI003FCF17D9
MDSMTCPGFLLLVSLLLGGTYGIDPLTSAPVLTYNVTFPESPLTSERSLKISSLLLLQDNRMLIGAVNSKDFSLRLLSFNQAGGEAHMEALDDLPGDVTTLALLSNGQVAMARRMQVEDKVYILEVSEGAPARVVSTIPLTRTDAKRTYRPVVAAGRGDNTFLVSTYHVDRGVPLTTIQVMSVDGTVIQTVTENLQFQVDNMAVFGDDVYITGEKMSDEERRAGMTRLSLDTKTITNNIGSLDLRELAGHRFYQGAFDDQGTFYVATFNSRACSNPDRDEQTCCRCIMAITREGQKRVIQPSDSGLPVHDMWHVWAVTSTPSGFAAASYVEWRTDSTEHKLSLIQFYDMA